MRKINKLLINSCFALLVLFSANAQKDKTKDSDKISLIPYVSDQIDKLPSHAKSMLLSKLTKVVLANGLVDVGSESRFIITPNITVLSKDLTSTAPPMTALNLQIDFYIGDIVSGIILENTSIELKGVGKNETKAYMSALKRIKPGNTVLKEFLEKGKSKIIDYYNNKCEAILQDVKTLEGQYKYEQAIAKLTSVPEAASDCYAKVNKIIVPIYQKQIDKDCKTKLGKATNIWNAAQDRKSANKVGKMLNTIDTNSSCYKSALELSEKIATEMKKNNEKEWELAMKIQQDNVDIKKAKIDAAKSIGIAYGKNQPEKHYAKVNDWW
ncbi:MAG: hypothetical protein HRT66_02880 [Flavobacteriaceae bacterium]|nr:hypothetical protein [Flavobacteriaceae bacterium]